jgi:hypothetical protein
MKMKNPITCALLTLGVISAASVAKADSTITIGGTSYAEVFITGSTAARGNVFNAVDAATGGVFDTTPTLVPSGANGKSGNYTAYGTIGGVHYCLCFSFTGSEAGLFAIQHNAGGLSNPILANTLGGNAAIPGALIPGTPTPTGFVNANNSTAFSAAPDLSMADTSQKVSLSQSPALTDYGIVGAVTFEWVKGKNTSPDQSYNDLTNVSDPQLNFLLGAPQAASFFTGSSSDSDLVFAAGRNRASGTHQNAMIDTQHGTGNAVDQWVPNNDTYTGAGVLTDNNGTAPQASLTTSGGIDEVFNDGFDSGGGVADTLSCDEAGSQNVASGGSIEATGKIIMIGYVGVSDGNTATGNGAKVLTLNGVSENDATVEQGAYSFWGHEHLYGEVTEDNAVQTVGQALAGTTVIKAFNGTAPNGALASAGGEGGGEANPASTQSTIILPQFMAADKPSGSDSGYPSQ